MKLCKEWLIAAARGVRPAERLEVDDWASKHVKIIDSATGSPEFTIEATPWLRDIMRAIASNDNKEVIVIAPVGSGKTTVLEGMLPWIVSEESGGTLIVNQSDTKAGHWAETRLFPSMRKCEPIKDFYPKDRHKVRKDEIIFPHMPMFIGGASMGNLQSSSMRWVFLDEPWLYKPGRIDEARGRTHDRWNARVVCLSQAGVTEETPWSEEMGNPDLDAAWNMTDKAELHWLCRSCGNYHLWRWEDFKFEKGEDSDRDWKLIDESVRMVCPTCQHEYRDEPKTRVQLANESKYFVQNENGVKGHRGFTYKSFVVPWHRWGKRAVEFVKAQDASKRGNLKPLRIFKQKREALPWHDMIGQEEVELIGSGYTKADYVNGEFLDDEYARVMTVDVQSAGGRHFWCVIRAWRKDGTSRLIREGRIQAWEILEETRDQYRVKNTCVFVDGQHETEDVKQHCAKYDWNILHGSATVRYPHKKGKRRVVQKPFSTRKHYQVGPRKVRYWHVGSDSIKDVLSMFMQGKALDWEIPDDASKEYHRQMSSETKKDIINEKTKDVQRRWVKTKQDNHLWDCENMAIAAAMILNILTDYAVNDESNENES